MLQYCRLATPPDEEVTALAPHDKKVALGTARGTVWILDELAGALSPGVRIEAHTGSIRDVAWDAAGMFLGSCGGNSISVHGRKHADDLDASSWEKIDESSCVGVSSITLEPLYGAPSKALFCGDSTGRVERRSKGLVSTTRQTVDDGDDVECTLLSWGDAFVAWRCATGVKLAHGDTATPAAFLACEGEGSTSLAWDASGDLWVARGETIRRISVQVDGWDDEGLPVTSASVTSTFHIDVLALQIVPHGPEHVAILSDEELLIVDHSGEVESADTLPVPCDHLVSTSAENWSREQWRTLGSKLEGTPPTLYLYGEAVVTCRVRDGDDLVDVCLEKGDTANALRVASSTMLGRHDVQNVASQHVEHLLTSSPEKAASVCHRFLPLTEWISTFDDHDQLLSLALLLPTKKKLAPDVYEDVLTRLSAKNGAALLTVIRTWGTHEPPLYDASNVADRIPTEHVEARAELFVLAKRPEKALDCLLDVQGTSIAPDAIQRLVADHGLFDEVARNASRFVRAARSAASLLFVSHVDVLPIDEMGEQLDGEDLAWYLQLCFEHKLLDAPELSRWHDMYVELHTDLSDFLRASSLYDKEKALQRCMQLQKWRDAAYLLGCLNREDDAISLLLKHNDLDGAARHAASSEEALVAFSERATVRPDLIAAALDAAADGCELDLPRVLASTQSGMEVPDLRKRYIGALQAKRLDAALLDAAAACASRDETLALERKLHVAQRGVLMEPPHEFDEDGNIIIERRDRYY
ncbi:unnamed protein product [Pelagomonas calceolata]|uniref:Vps41 beta-propeller domain-containing protein n=1 Tax=Pelagomonas calceolata TaxID=35677 RepID=A0A8J2SGY8_9STRA|nr:unnamed protein product [Pelagomonas calceolata]